MNIKEIYKLGIPLTLASSLILGLIVNDPSHTQVAQKIDPGPFINKTEKPIKLAGITRSCNAYYLVVSPSLSAKYGHKVAPFYATRGCGSSVPNRCRRRARDAAHTCMQDHWSYKKVMPQSCQYREGVHNYNVINLADTLTGVVCRYTDDPYFRADIYRVTKGDKGYLSKM
ncbi:MAG: hypothetical protein AB4206_08710 [Xenococcaceae cyanobacterium]